MTTEENLLAVERLAEVAEQWADNLPWWKWRRKRQMHRRAHDLRSQLASMPPFLRYPSTTRPFPGGK